MKPRGWVWRRKWNGCMTGTWVDPTKVYYHIWSASGMTWGCSMTTRMGGEVWDFLPGVQISLWRVQPRCRGPILHETMVLVSTPHCLFYLKQIDCHIPYIVPCSQNGDGRAEVYYYWSSISGSFNVPRYLHFLGLSSGTRRKVESTLPSAKISSGSTRSCG